MTNLLLLLIIILLAGPHLELPRPVMMVTAIICIIIGVVVVLFGGRISIG